MIEKPSFGATEVSFDDSAQRRSAPATPQPKVSIRAASPARKITTSFFRLAAVAFLEGYTLPTWQALTERERAAVSAAYGLSGNDMASATETLEWILTGRSSALHRFRGDLFKEV